MSYLMLLHSEIRRVPKAWLGLRLICAILWALELFWVQSLAFQDQPWMRHPVLIQLIRFSLNLMFTTGLVFLVRRRFSIGVMAFGSVAALAIATYARYFHWPLMPERVLSQFTYGWQLRSGLPLLVSFQVVAVLGAFFAAKAFLLIKSKRYDFPKRAGWTLALLLVSAYVSIVLLVQFRFRSANNPQDHGRDVYIYGYSVPWIFELLAFSSVEEHSRQAQAYLSRHYDRLTSEENAFPVEGNLVVLQLETVSGKAMEARHGGEDIMPFAKKLRDGSFRFRIEAFHRNGSCDMDYAATTGVEPYPGLIPYKLRGMRYTNSIPSFMKQHGFETFFFHGNTGHFYDRRGLISELGFDHILFKEELATRRLPMSSMMGIRDAALLDCMSAALRTNTHAYVFGITLDTHAPFQQLSPGEMEIFPQPASAVERYLNALRYLDNCLRRFVADLPEGTTLVLYGDHTAAFSTDVFQSDVVAGIDYVECLIFKKGVDLTGLQKTRDTAIAVDGRLNLLDMLNYLRSSVEKAAPAHSTRVVSPENSEVQPPKI